MKSALNGSDGEVRSDEDVRRALVEALASMAPEVKEAIPVLIENLNAESRWDFFIEEALLQYKAEAVPELIKALPRKEVFDVLGDLGPDAKDAVPAVVKVLRSPPREYHDARDNAVACLAKIGPAAKEAIPALTELLQDDGSKLNEKRRQGWHHEQFEFAVALIHIDSENAAAIAHLKKAESSKDPGAQVRATFELARANPRDADAVRRLGGYAQTFPMERARVVGYLGELGPRAKEFFPLAKELMADPPRNVLGPGQMYEAAVKIDPAAAVPLLMPLLRHKNADTRQQAMRALAKAGAHAKVAVPVLRELATDDPDNDEHEFEGLFERQLAINVLHQIEGTKPPRRTPRPSLAFEPVNVDPATPFRLASLASGRQFDGMDPPIRGAQITADQRWVVAWGEDDDGFLTRLGRALGKTAPCPGDQPDANRLCHGLARPGDFDARAAGGRRRRGHSAVRSQNRQGGDFNDP